MPPLDQATMQRIADRQGVQLTPENANRIAAFAAANPDILERYSMGTAPAAMSGGRDIRGGAGPQDNSALLDLDRSINRSIASTELPPPTPQGNMQTAMVGATATPSPSRPAPQAPTPNQDGGGNPAAPSYRVGMDDTTGLGVPMPQGMPNAANPVVMAPGTGPSGARSATAVDAEALANQPSFMERLFNSILPLAGGAVGTALLASPPTSARGTPPVAPGVVNPGIPGYEQYMEHNMPQGRPSAVDASSVQPGTMPSKESQVRADVQRENYAPPSSEGEAKLKQQMGSQNATADLVRRAKRSQGRH